MRFRSYKNADLTVSEVGFGVRTVSTRLVGNFTEGETVALMHYAFDLGQRASMQLILTPLIRQGADRQGVSKGARRDRDMQRRLATILCTTQTRAVAANARSHRIFLRKRTLKLNVEFIENASTPESFRRKSVTMSSRLDSFRALAIAALLASCAEPKKPAAVERASLAGSRFDGVGRVRLHAGQPCTPQIMFDFRTTSSNTVWLAAPMPETKILTEAADRQRRVRISGKWRRGRQTGCSYVDVTQVNLLK